MTVPKVPPAPPSHTANANDTVGVIFDKVREQRRLDEAEVIDHPPG